MLPPGADRGGRTGVELVLLIELVLHVLNTAAPWCQGLTLTTRFFNLGKLGPLQIEKQQVIVKCLAIIGHV